MPMNEEVRKAVESFDEWLDFIFAEYPSGEKNWQTIRAELTRLYAIADSVDPLVVRLGEVTMKLEAANALLRECQSRIGELCRVYGNPIPEATFDRINAHLSEPRTC